MACPTAKQAYPSPSAAVQALQAIRARRRKPGAKEPYGGVGIEVYRCDRCHLWHHGRGITQLAKRRNRNA